jgi:hypothetical protein
MSAAVTIRETQTFRRRTIFTVIAGGAMAATAAAAVLPAAPPVPASRTTLLLDSFIAGTANTDFARALPGLAAGQRLILKREALNEHDGRAIAVYAGEGPAAGAKLGYVPRAKNEALTALIDEGRSLKAELTGLDPDRWDGARLSVRLAE